MNEMIERVARAISGRLHENTFASTHDLARVAIEAMTTPTDKIESVPTQSIAFSAGEIWRMMIREALK